jgi:ABC-type Fe3+ transport system permease subunit
VTSGDRFLSWKVNDKVIISVTALEIVGTAIASWVWRGLFGASSWGVILNSFLIAILFGAIVLILGRLHSYYLDENERIAKGLRTLDDW